MHDPKWIIGIDASEKATGLVAVPAAWDLDQWQRVEATTLEPVEVPGVAMRRNISRRVAAFAAKFQPAAVYIEDYPRHGAFNIGRLAELHGVIKDQLAELGLHVVPVNISSARKLLLGKLPTGKGAAKRTVLNSLRSVWMRGIDDAKADAFCVANFGRSELGLWCVAA